jgi:bifunctional UDP-N-acetylglucosamine pyrophosphorylase / glucosamine-1-phosphate N-acetyltransferase
MPELVSIAANVAEFAGSPLARWSELQPWELTSRSEQVVRVLLEALLAGEFSVSDGVAVHRTATVEAGAVLKGPLIVGASCFVASGAYLRGGCWVAPRCIFGPGAELKSSFVFSGTKLAHFNFVGDSILGSNVNLEAGSIICNYRNERASKEILVRLPSGLAKTGVEKFGAFVGDSCRIGANAVLAPGTLLPQESVVRRTALCDQEML